MRTMILVEGRVGQIKDLHTFNDGKGAVLNLSIAETPRKKQGNEWVDGETNWHNVVLWNDLAYSVQNAINAGAVEPGTMLIVYGVQETEKYTTKDTQEERTATKLNAYDVAVSLNRFQSVTGVEKEDMVKKMQGGVQSSGPKVVNENSFAQPEPKDEPVLETGDDDDSLSLFGDDDGGSSLFGDDFNIFDD